MYITIDGGTTNTRLSLFDCTVKDTVRLNMGARLGLSDKEGFFGGIRKSIYELLDKNGLSENDISAVLASGMITSEGGLLKVDHVPAPAGIKELNKGIKEAKFPEIFPQSFYFIPGVRMFGDNFANTDVMRGEETEVTGIRHMMDIKEAGTFILPGSHSKLIFTDENGTIYDFFTAMTGEMIASLSSGTILAQNIDLKNARINDMLYEGCEYTWAQGLNKSLFKVRILSSFLGADKDDAYSFFMGCVLADEIRAVKASEAKSVYIAGKAQIKEAEAMLLKRLTDKNVIMVPDRISDAATSFGMVRIFDRV